MKHGIPGEVGRRPQRFSNVPPLRGRRTVLTRDAGPLLDKVTEHRVSKGGVGAQVLEHALNGGEHAASVSELVTEYGQAGRAAAHHARRVRMALPIPAHIASACCWASRIARAPAPVTLNMRRERPPRTGSGSLAREVRSPFVSSRCNVV